MKRVNFYLTDNQVFYLGQLPGTVSEHIREAIDQYLEEWYPKLEYSPSVSKSTSPSVAPTKGGDKHTKRT